jgi:hypothetical protein
LQNIFEAGDNKTETTMMQTYSQNKLAEMLEVDRATIQRCLRTTPPDAGEDTSRPTWRIATAANSLAAHRASIGRVDHRHPHNGGGGNGSTDTMFQDRLLTQLFAEQDEAMARLRTLPTLDGRRKAAIAMVPLISRVDAAVRQRGKLNGLDSDAVDLRADSLYMLQLREFEKVCEWDQAQVRAAMAEKVTS